MGSNIRFFKSLIQVLLFASIASTAFAQDFPCPPDEFPDCNDNCFPVEWVFDDICDEGIREWPEGSGVYIDLSCEIFFCDLFTCEGCEMDCPEGEIPDCNGNCAPIEWLEDDICDVGQRTYNGEPIYFACPEYGCDTNNCSGACWDDQNYDSSPLDIGACCMGTDCSEMTRADCWSSGFTFIGADTQCLSNTCECGEGWIADCNGNCLPLQWAGGNYCSHGEIMDFGNGEFEIDLDCPELACGLSGCIGSCPGACCNGGDCFITPNFQSCLDIGGIFLGSYVECESDLLGCTEVQRPIQLPDTELYWSGALGEVGDFPRWIEIEGDLLCAGATVNDTEDRHGYNIAICVYRYNSVKEEWVEEALLELPDNHFDGWTKYAIDDSHIAVTSIVDAETPDHRWVVDIFSYEAGGWSFTQTIDRGIPANDLDWPWPTSIDILDDILLTGHAGLNADEEQNDGGGYIYEFDGSSWELTATLSPFGTPSSPPGEDRYLGMSAALGEQGDTRIAALSSQESLLIYDISELDKPYPLQHISDMGGNNWPRPKSLDIDEGRIMTRVGGHYDWSVFGSGIFEHNGDEWVLTEILTPFDYVADDDTGWIANLNGDTALLTAPNDDDLGYDTGSAYIWRQNQEGDWIFKAKLWSDWADAYDQFGIGGAVHNSVAYMTGNLESDGDCIKVFWPRGITWIEPLEGEIDDEENWDPQLPVIGDAVSIALRAEPVITLDDVDIPFSSLFIGPGEPIFDLLGATRSFGNGGETLLLQGVPNREAILVIRNGTLDVNGEVHLGESGLPAEISLQSSIDDEDVIEQGRLFVHGLYLQPDSGALDVSLFLAHPEPALKIFDVAPRIRGVLGINLEDSDQLQAGDILPIVTSEYVDDETGNFSVVMIHDELPDGLYMRIEYSSSPNEDGEYVIYAEVASLDGLFGYGDPNGTSVAGLATSVSVGDVSPTSRAGDGFDDIVVTTKESVYIFFSDGNGGIASQMIITDASFEELSAVGLGDFDSDGDNDIVVTDTAANQIIPIFNISESGASFEVGDGVSTGLYPIDIAVMDTNSDGDDDIIVACEGSSNTNGSIDFFSIIDTPGRGGGLGSDGSISLLGQPSGVDPGDVNDDKDLDFGVAFKGQNEVGKGSRSTSLDGDFDWVITDRTSVAIGPTDIQYGDLNNDGLSDIVVVCPISDAVCVLTGIAGGGFSTPLQIDVGLNPTSVALLDFDNDVGSDGSPGDQDVAIVTTNPTTGNRAIVLYRNDTSLNGGNLLFAQEAILDDGANPIFVSKGDLDQDGVEDLVSVTSVASFRGSNSDVLMRTAVGGGSCQPDLDGNGTVGVDDLLLVIAAWGQTGALPEDLDQNGVVGVDDLLILIAAWGSCP